MKIKSLVFSTLFFVAATSTAILFNACEKSEAELPKDDAVGNTVISLKDDALCFQTAEDFFDTSEKLGAMTRGERDAWEESLGFKSMRAELNSVFDAIAETDDEAMVNEIVSLNSDIVKVQDGEIVPIIESSAYAAISNRSGIFYVEGVVHKVEEGFASC